MEIIKIMNTVLILIIGIILGSFYACIGYRIPKKISIVKPNSFCPKCKTPLKWYMNIPVLSYAFLKGKCKNCKEKISPLYIIIELFTGVSFLLTYLYFDFAKEFFILIVLISALSITIVTDFTELYISDRVTLTSLLLIIGIDVYFIGINETIYYLISALIMYALMYIIKICGDKAFKKESLGGGDVKLMLLIGLTLGIINAITSLLISSTLALITSLIFLKKDEEKLVPFGPFLIIGTITMFILAYHNITII